MAAAAANAGLILTGTKALVCLCSRQNALAAFQARFHVPRAKLCGLLRLDRAGNSALPRSEPALTVGDRLKKIRAGDAGVVSG